MCVVSKSTPRKSNASHWLKLPETLYNILTRDREADALTSIATNKTPLARQLHLVLMVKKVTLYSK